MFSKSSVIARTWCSGNL